MPIKWILLFVAAVMPFSGATANEAMLTSKLACLEAYDESETLDFSVEARADIQILSSLPDLSIGKAELREIGALIDAQPQSSAGWRKVFERIGRAFDKQRGIYAQQLVRLETKLLNPKGFDPALIEAIEKLQKWIIGCRPTFDVSELKDPDSGDRDARAFEKQITARLRGERGPEPLDEVERLSILNTNQKLELKQAFRETGVLAKSRWIEKIRSIESSRRFYTYVEDADSLLRNYLGSQVSISRSSSKAEIVSLDGKRKAAFDGFARYFTLKKLSENGDWDYAYIKSYEKYRYVRANRGLSSAKATKNSHFSY